MEAASPFTGKNDDGRGPGVSKDRRGIRIGRSLLRR